MSDRRDPAAPHDHRDNALSPAPRAQWLGLLLAPLAFLAHLQANYLLVQWSCHRGRSHAWVHVAAAAAIALAAAGFMAAWQTWTRSRTDEPSDAGSIAARSRLIGLSGLGLSAIMVLVLAAQLVASFVVPRCQ